MRLARALLYLVACLCAGVASAQEFPSHAVKIVATFPPGGSADLTARFFAEKLQELWKQGVVVENRVGGGGSIGAEAVFRAPPDGYTLLLASNTHIINHVLIKNLSYDFTKDFAPVAMVTSSPMMIATNPSFPAKNIKELTALLKANPGKYEYASCNMASPHHFAMEMYKHALNIDVLHIPHRGCGPASTDAVAGHIKIISTNVPTSLPFVKDGKLRPIALLSSQRSPSLPDIPTLRDSGIPELKNVFLDNYYGFMAPPGTPAPILAKLEADVKRVAAMPDLQKRLADAGFEMYVLGPGDMMKVIRTDAAKYAEAAKQANIKLD